MTLLQIGNMPVDLLLTQRSLPFGDCGNEFIQLIGLDHRHGVGANVVGCATRIDHAVGHLSLERAVSGESHDADKIRLVDSEVVCECADVLVVLPHRILEAALLAVDGLRPILALLVAEYPARVCLRLDDENAVLRNDDVVNLRRRPVRQRQVDVVQNPVLVGQPFPQPTCDQLLAALALLLRTVPPEQKYPKHDQKREHASQHPEYRLE